MKIFFLLILISSAAFAGEEKIRLIKGPGHDKVLANCMMCHSVDYIQMNSGFLDKAGWEKTVNKMIKVMGAPIQEKDVPEIVDYLTKYYGTEKKPGDKK